MYWHFVRELLYKIEWPPIRRLCIGILCTYSYFVRVLPYSVIKSNQSPWDSGSRIDTPSQNVGSYCIGQLNSWVRVGRLHNTVMGRIVVPGELVTKVSAAGFPINETLALPGAVLDPIESHVYGFGYFLFDCAIGEAFFGIVVNAYWSRWLWVPKVPVG